MVCVVYVCLRGVRVFGCVCVHALYVCVCMCVAGAELVVLR